MRQRFPGMTSCTLFMGSMWLTVRTYLRIQWRFDIFSNVSAFTTLRSTQIFLFIGLVQHDKGLSDSFDTELYTYLILFQFLHGCVTDNQQRDSPAPKVFYCITAVSTTFANLHQLMLKVIARQR